MQQGLFLPVSYVLFTCGGADRSWKCNLPFFPTNNALLIIFRLSSDAEILSISTDWAYESAPNMQNTCMQRVHILTELPFRTQPLVVGFSFALLLAKVVIFTGSQLWGFQAPNSNLIRFSTCSFSCPLWADSILVFFFFCREREGGEIRLMIG